MINKRTGKLKEKIIDYFSAIINEKTDAKTKFLNFYSKPEKTQIIGLTDKKKKTRQDFLEIVSIRKIDISHDEMLTKEENMMKSSCTCQDYFGYNYCVHSIACFWKMGLMEEIVVFQKAKKRGRKPGNH